FIPFALFRVGRVVYRLVVVAAEIRVAFFPTVVRATFGGGVKLFVQPRASHTTRLVFRRAVEDRVSDERRRDAVTFAQGAQPRVDGVARYRAGQLLNVLRREGGDAPLPAFNQKLPALQPTPLAHLEIE